MNLGMTWPADPHRSLLGRPVELAFAAFIRMSRAGNEMMPRQGFFATADGAITDHGLGTFPKTRFLVKIRDSLLGFCGAVLTIFILPAMNASTKIAVLSAFLASAISANAAIINLDLLGKAGVGLLAGNENAVITGTPGSGGEIGAGIFFNDITLQLTINVGWGSGNGFLNLTSNANNSHIHGPTASGGAASFTQDAVVLFNLPRVSDSLSNGSIATTVTLTPTQATELLAGRYYINVHTITNGGGEIRGNIVPEPSSIAFLSLGVLGLIRRRR